MPYVCALLYVVIALGVLIGCITQVTLCFLLSALIIFVLIFVGTHYSWYKYAYLEQEGNYLTYKVTGVLNELGQNTSVYLMETIDSYELRGSTCVVYGRIIYKEPLRKPKVVKKVKILDITTEGVTLIQCACLSS